MAEKSAGTLRGDAREEHRHPFHAPLHLCFSPRFDKNRVIDARQTMELIVFRYLIPPRTTTGWFLCRAVPCPKPLGLVVCATFAFSRALEMKLKTQMEMGSFLMKKMDAGMIKMVLASGQVVQVEMAWSLPAPDDRVEWSLWTSAVDSSAAVSPPRC